MLVSVSLSVIRRSSMAMQIQTGRLTTTRKSQSGFTFLNGPVDSPAEAEVMAFCSATQQSMWSRSILAEIGLPRHEPTIIYEDNSGAIELVSNSVISKRLKHVDIRLCFVNDAIEKKIVVPIKVPTAGNLADIFTKALPRNRFQELASYFVS